MKTIRYACGHKEQVKKPVTLFQASVQNIMGKQDCPTCQIHDRLKDTDYATEEG